MGRRTMMQVQLGVPDPQPVTMTAAMLFMADVFILLMGGVVFTAAMVAAGG